MIDIKIIRDHFEDYKKTCERRGCPVNLDTVLALHKVPSLVAVVCNFINNLYLLAWCVGVKSALQYLRYEASICWYSSKLFRVLQG